MAKTDTDAAEPAGLHEWSGHTRDRTSWQVRRGDAAAVLKTLPANRFQCAVTSPPYYWQRDYEVEGQLGLEPSIDEYVSALVGTFSEVRRVLRKDGVFFLNMGDTYYSAKGKPKGNDRKNRARRFGLRAVDASGLGVPRKTTLGMPWRVALGMIGDGWILRSPIIWQRANSLPEATSHDRPWRTYEMLFMFSKSPRYQFDRAQLQGDEDVWRISSKPSKAKGLHSAAFPEELASRCIQCSTKAGQEVLDPFVGTGTTMISAARLGRPSLGVDLNQTYCEFAAKRLGEL